MKVNSVRWITCGETLIGFVSGVDDITGEKKIYAGLGLGISEGDDINRILKIGGKVNAKEMAEFFADAI